MLDFENVISFNGSIDQTTFPSLDKCNFFAKHIPLYIDPKDDGGLIELTKEQGQAVIRTDTGQFLGRTGGRYGIAQNPETNDVVMQSLEMAFPAKFLKGITLEEKTSDNGAFSKWTYTFPEAAQQIRQLRDATGYEANRYGQHFADTWLNFEISVVNSFNGLTPLFLQAGHKDVSCLNSLTMSFLDTSKQRHSSKIDPAKFADWIAEQASEFKTKIDVWQGWADRSITPEQAEDTLKDAGVSDRLTKSLMMQFEDEAAARGRSVWALASAISYQSTHNSERFGVRGSGKRDNEARSLHNRQNQALAIMSSEPWGRLAAAAA